MGVELRPLQAEHVELWADLLAACEQVDQTGEHYDADDLDEEYSDPNRDRAGDFIGAWIGDRLIGVATVFARDQAGDVHSIQLESWVHPDERHRQVGAELLAAALERAGEAHRAMFPDVPAEVRSQCLVGDEAAAALLAGAGFSPVRWFFTMEVSFSAAPPRHSLPAELTARRYRQVSADAVRVAHNVAFADHWGFAGWSPSMWQQWVDDTRSFRPEWSRVLIDDTGTVAAYVLMYEYEAEQAVTGRRSAYVGKVGVRPAWRRRGIASALLGNVLHECYVDGGYRVAALDVDADNPTGALGIYERLGFVTTTRWVAQTLTLPAFARRGRSQ